jgi:hypothetical protein
VVFGQSAPPGAVTAQGRRPLYLLSRSSDRREWPPFGPPAGAARLRGRPGEECSLDTSRPARRLPTGRQERFAGPEDLLWGPHLGARDPSGGRSWLGPSMNGLAGDGPPDPHGPCLSRCGLTM